MISNQEKISLTGLINQLSSKFGQIECTGLTGASKAWTVYNLYKKLKKPLVVVAHSSQQAEQFLQDLEAISDGQVPGIYLPAYNVGPYKWMALHNEISARRISALYQMVSGESIPILVTPCVNLMRKMVPKSKLIQYTDLIMRDEDLDRDQFVEKLVSSGYIHTLVVEEPGDFSVRGGILDVFTSAYERPIRMEFFGDTVEAMRFFSPVTQRAQDAIEEAIILPAREIIVSPEEKDQIINRFRIRAAEQGIAPRDLAPIIEQFRQQGTFTGIENLLSLVYPQPDILMDYLSDPALWIFLDWEETERAVNKAEEQIFQNYLAAVKENRLCAEPAHLYVMWQDIAQRLADGTTLRMCNLAVTKSDEPSPIQKNTYHLDIESTSQLSGEMTSKSRERQFLLQPLVNWISDTRAKGCATVMFCGNPSRAKRLLHLLEPYGLVPLQVDEFQRIVRKKKGIYLCIGEVSSGFVWPDEALAVITESEIFGSASTRIRPKRPQPHVHTEVLTFEDLKQGDFVVHAEHGIGRYEGLVKLTINNAVNDFIQIVYRDNDKLYLPVDRMNVMRKYLGVEGVQPVLDKIGGKTWDRVKSKVKKSVEKMAKELLHLYAARKVHKGHAYRLTDKELREFETGFAYEETPDQQKAIENVLDDMMSDTPMDRLVCGDVGYGKTEVALRAAFMAVNEARQVAVLVPTTVLAEQHFTTFSQRFAQYPVEIRCLNRFRSQKEQRDTIKGIQNGTVDIVIGTHRLLSADIKFKDLGLIILDEEHRFGVRHKEKLKQLRTQVDVLTLTATPIPRTLHMSMVGIRDISVISTPPEQRHPIITYICEWDDHIIAEAIQRERERDGQLFFVHNNIKTIWKTAAHIQRIDPQVRLEVAHGQMKEKELELAMHRFLNNEIDMLVCTSIIEAGLDVPSANTILINRADKFGLAQIYQLRGRVGRANEQAYAYLFIPPESNLTRNAQKRLKVLMEHSDLGSGFQIAMNDLRIRGGGTILGASQSGHIAAVGYEMFLELMENAVAELKGESRQAPLDPEINVDMSAYLPEFYISDIDQRLAIYRRLSKMTELSELSDMKAELTDRFGPLPREVTNLLLKMMLRTLAKKAGVRRLDLNGAHLTLTFSPVHQKNPAGLVDMILANKRLFQMSPNQTLSVDLSQIPEGSAIASAKNILKEIILRVNN